MTPIQRARVLTDHDMHRLEAMALGDDAYRDIATLCSEVRLLRFLLRRSIPVLLAAHEWLADDSPDRDERLQAALHEHYETPFITT